MKTEVENRSSIPELAVSRQSLFCDLGDMVCVVRLALLILLPSLSSAGIADMCHHVECLAWVSRHVLRAYFQVPSVGLLIPSLTIHTNVSGPSFYGLPIQHHEGSISTALPPPMLLLPFIDPRGGSPHPPMSAKSRLATVTRSKWAEGQAAEMEMQGKEELASHDHSHLCHPLTY